MRPTAVLCDAMGTLVRFDRPVERMRGSLAARGIVITHDEAVAALTAEVRLYRDEHLTAVDLPSIEALRRRCADALRLTLPKQLDHERAYSVLAGLIRFEVLPTSRESLTRLRRAGISIAVVSNWDASLRGTMLAVGLAGHVDAVVSSAEVGRAKPDPALLARGLELLGGVDPSQAVMVGDHAVDHAAAAALGMPSLLVEPGSGIAAAVDAILDLPA
ncbi:MAG: HAD-IA family hydrolase [Solirubrobacteraceae bacterium]|nr:HAD-IA family hydrolase [Patulibacter sp.]